MNKLKTIYFVLSVFISTTIADRKLQAVFNPGCMKETNCSDVSKLVYIRAEGDNDTVHFVFDFTYKPSLVVLKTSIDSVIQVNYTEQYNTINFTKTPSYTFASVFNYLYEFEDVNDTALIGNGENIIKMDFKQFNWNMTQLQTNNEFVKVIISANSYRGPNIMKTGIVSITLNVYGKKDQGSMFPHLIHTPESGELTLILNQLQTIYTNSRFAVELLSISSFPFNKTEELSYNTFSDDKSSGGTFLNYMVNAKGDNEEEGGGYLSWKPVIYKAADTHPFNSSSTVQYDIHDYFDEKDWIFTPLYKLYNNQLFTNQFLKKANNVSFGEPNDGFYAKSNYLYWTFLVGFGTSPNSNVGLLEMSIIAGLLLILTITMILIFCVFMRWISSKRNSIIYGQ